MQVPNSAYREERSIGALLASLARDTGALIRGEAELARQEVSNDVSQAAIAIASVMIAAVSMIGGFIVLLGAAVFGLSTVLPPQLVPWLSELIVGAFFMLLGAGFLLQARRRLKARNLKPRRTLQGMERDREVLREHREHLQEPRV